MSIPRLGLIVICVCILIGAVGLFRSEFREVTVREQSDASVYLNAIETPPTFEPVYAIKSQVAQMERCEGWLVSGFGNLVGKEGNDNVAQACLGRAEEVLKKSPTLSIAHLAKSGALNALGDRAAAVDALDLAQSTAPFEGWLAAKRFRMLFLMGDFSSDDFQRLALHDARVLIQDRQYFPMLAAMYVRYPEQRDWFTSNLENENPKDLRRFLGEVKRRLS